MDIRNISIYSNGFGGQRNAGGKSSFLGIGQKGQIVQGMVTKVGENITLNFNGIEVAVSKGAVRNAREGEIRDFEIMNVSADSIVLKEVSETESAQPVRGMMSTSVAASDYSFTECLEASKDTAQAQKDANESLAVMTGADYEAIEQEEGSLTESTKECVERATQKRKERVEWTQERLEEGARLRKELQESLEQIQANGFLSQKSEGQLRRALQEAGIPVTTETIDKVVNALEMSQSALELTDRSKAYIISENLAPTLGNLYQGKYSATQGMSGTNMQNFAEYKEQIDKILQECGRADAKGLQNAKWLFANELPINEESLSKLEVLNGISEKMTPDKVLDQILFAMTAGLSPKDAVMDDSLFLVARDAIEDFKGIDDAVIHHTVDVLVKKQMQDLKQSSEKHTQSGERGQRELMVNLEMLRQMQAEVTDEVAGKAEIPVVYVADMSETDILKVTMKRQLEEIRQKMTVQSALAMEQRGIHVETESLDNIIHSLREIENAYYSRQVAGDAGEISPQQLDLLQESLGKTADIANAHAAILGTGVRQQTLLTMNELHAAISSQTANRNDWNSVFEKVSTQVRADLGDSIQKAFEGVPKMLEDMAIESTQANVRAARILGYNGMEITEESLEQVKVFDAKVNRVLDNMKPAVVLELLRRGENPLDMPLDELNLELEKIQEEKGITSEERYSRFLWQMEKSGQITENERKGYIGVYRLLNQLQKADGAAIGAVIETGQELTLGNLLKQVRTRRSGGVDSVVDEVNGSREAKPVTNSITEQINTGFAQAAGSEQTEYYRYLAEEALTEITPSKLEEMTDGDMQRLLNTSLEKFCEELKQTTGNAELKKAYFEEQAEVIREKINSGEAAEAYLSKLQVENTIGNILAAEAVLEDGYMPFKEGYERRKVLSKERQEELEKTVDSMVEAIGEEEALLSQCEKAEKIMEEILTKSYEQADISFEDLSKLRILGQGIHLEGALRQSKSYDIPIRTGDSITSLNLTLIHGSEESGRIQISMADETFGNISLDIKVSEGKVKGLVLCDRRQGFEALQEQNEALVTDLERAGYPVKNISYGMDFKSRNELLSEAVKKQEADTADLYQIAKILVRSVTAVIKE